MKKLLMVMVAAFLVNFAMAQEGKSNRINGMVIAQLDLTDDQKEKVFARFGPEKHMQLYDRGIRRRLAPMLNNDRRRLELAYSLQFTLRGTPEGDSARS